MGKLERESKIRTRNTKITRAIFTTLALAVAGTLNPQGLVRGVLRELKVPKEKRIMSENAVYVARRRLARQGYIRFSSGFWEITDKGKIALSMMGSSALLVKKAPRWDKKWRILIFDIREERRGLRDKVRRSLLMLGFRRLQDSVWIYPYDCEDFVALLKADFKIGKDLLYIIADQLENDIWLRKEFDLI